MSRLQIPVEGMTCSGCERTVTAALSGLAGVQEVSADHRADRVRVSFDSERIDEQRLRAQIEEVGYQPRWRAKHGPTAPGVEDLNTGPAAHRNRMPRGARR
jgi:copper chaperone